MVENRDKQLNQSIAPSIQVIDDDWKKYNKRINNLIDDVAIEAEIEAERKIRSKNSKLLTISIVGIAFLTLIFLKVQQYSDLSQTGADKKILPQDASLPPKKFQQVNSKLSRTSPQLVAQLKKPFKDSTKLEKILFNTQGYSQPESAEEIINESDPNYYIQLGAFSIKKNALNFKNKVESKGFKAALSPHSAKSTQYKVLVRNFRIKSNAQLKMAKLKASGIESSIKKLNNSYTLDMGNHNNKKSNSLARKLQERGLETTIEKILVNSKVYTVRINGIKTKNDAQITRQKLMDQGFQNSFIG